MFPLSLSNTFTPNGETLNSFAAGTVSTLILTATQRQEGTPADKTMAAFQGGVALATGLSVSKHLSKSHYSRGVFSAAVGLAAVYGLSRLRRNLSKPLKETDDE